MKSYKGLYRKMISKENIKKCVLKATRGKRDRKDVQWILNNLDDYVLQTQEMLDDAVKNQNLVFPKHKVRAINDGIKQKVRYIVSPSFNEQVLHHMIMSVVAPIVYRRLDKGCCGSIPKRGGSKAKYIVENYIKKNRYNDNTNYVLKLDIKHFFPSINHDKMFDLVCKYLRDSELRYIIREVINNYHDTKNNNTEYGLPIGYYTSQWFANWYLCGLDHYIRNTLGVECYVRYMDDIVIFGKSAKDLHIIKVLVENYLNNYLDLKLNSKWQVFMFKRKTSCSTYQIVRPLSFVGYRFYNDRVILRKELMIRITRKANKIIKSGKLNSFVSAQMMSYKGWLDSCNMKNYVHKYIDNRIKIGILIKLISLKNKLVKRYKLRQLKHIQIFKGGVLYDTVTV